jgi:hypothetical protein
MKIPGMKKMVAWFRGMVREAVAEAIVGGVQDGTADAIERITGERPEVEAVPVLAVEVAVKKLPKKKSPKVKK